jgi:hypothetical protein
MSTETQPIFSGAGPEIHLAPEDRTEEILDIMERFAEMKNLVIERIHGKNARSTERAVETMNPVKDGFLLSLRDQFKLLLENKLIKAPAAATRVNFFITELDKMIEENNTRSGAKLNLEDASPEVQQILISANKAGIIWQDYINNSNLDDTEKRRLFIAVHNDLGAESEISETVPKDVADRRLAHLTDIEDYLTQVIEFMGDALYTQS